MNEKTILPKITYKEAKKMEKYGFVMMHIDWFSPSSGIRYDWQSLYPDCSHILINENNNWHWRNIITHAAAVITDPTEEADANLRIWKRDTKFNPKSNLAEVQDIVNKIRINGSMTHRQ